MFNPSAMLPSNMCMSFFIKRIECRFQTLLIRLESIETQKHLSSFIINFRDKLKCILGKEYFSDYKSSTIQQINWPVAVNISSFPQWLMFPQLSLKRSHNSVHHVLSYVLSFIQQALFSSYRNGVLCKACRRMYRMKTNRKYDFVQNTEKPV